MAACTACELLPARPEAAWLYLWPAAPHLMEPAFDAARFIGVTAERIDGETVRWTGRRDLIDEALRRLAGGLGQQARSDTRVLIVAEGSEPGLADFRRVTALDGMIAADEAQWLVEMIAEDRLETHFQPIIEVAWPDRIHAYECLLRGRAPDGSIVAPGPMFEASKDAGLLFQLDLAARRKAVQAVARHRLTTRALINFTPTSIYDPATCLRSTVATARELDLDPNQIVFEIIETEHAEERHLKKILDVYRSAGFAIAIDDFGAGYSSMNLLNALRPDYLKLDMQLIRGIDSDPYKAELARGLLETARNLAIKTIAEGIETEAEWRWVAAHGADYAQGYFFARPAATPTVPAFRAASMPAAAP